MGLHVRVELIVHALLVRLHGQEELRERRSADGGGGGGPTRTQCLLELPLDQLEQLQQAGTAHERQQAFVEGRAVALAEGAVGEGAGQVEGPRRDAPLVLVARVGAVATLGRGPLAVVPAWSEAAERATLAAPGSDPSKAATLERPGDVGMRAAAQNLPRLQWLVACRARDLPHAAMHEALRSVRSLETRPQPCTRRGVEHIRQHHDLVRSPRRAAQPCIDGGRDARAKRTRVQ